MKRKDLFGLGIMLSCIGTSVFVSVSFNMHIQNRFIFAVLLASSLITAIGGYIMLFAAFDR